MKYLIVSSYGQPWCCSRCLILRVQHRIFKKINFEAQRSGFKIERRQSEATEVSTHSVSFAAEPNGAELLSTKSGV